MNKEQLLQRYIDVEINTFIRADKSKKLGELIDDARSAGFLLSLADVLDIINKLAADKITIRQPFFLQLLYPPLKQAIELNDMAAIKSLISLAAHFGNLEKFTGENLYTSWSLLDKGLQLNLDDRELLTWYEQQQHDYLDYTLHELPAGVLFGADGASIDECDELIQELTKYELVCNKLEIDQSSLINDCKFYYTTYRNYLSVYKNYNGFSDYLDQQKNK